MGGPKWPMVASRRRWDSSDLLALSSPARLARSRDLSKRIRSRRCCCGCGIDNETAIRAKCRSMNRYWRWSKKCPAACAAGLSLPSGTDDASWSVFLEGEQDVEDLLAVARLLQVADGAFAAVGDARFGDLVVRHFVERGDVLGPDHALDREIAHLEVDAHLLAALDHQVAVGHDLRDHRRHAQVDLFRARG